jgi:hypothetical protein
MAHDTDRRGAGEWFESMPTLYMPDDHWPPEYESPICPVCKEPVGEATTPRIPVELLHSPPTYGLSDRDEIVVHGRVCEDHRRVWPTRPGGKKAVNLRSGWVGLPAKYDDGEIRRVGVPAAEVPTPPR